MTALRPKHQRLFLVVIALVVLLGAGLLASYALRNQADYFYFPEQLRDNPPPVDQAIRLGGMVEKGTLETLPDGVTIRFAVTGREAARIPVQFTGIVPDLFVEGSGVIAEGRLKANGLFVADNLLAKHDENYVPRELQDMNPQHASRLAEGATVGRE
jgi:cytochrome c-type biogenesis protein CcmE